MQWLKDEYINTVGHIQAVGRWSPAIMTPIPRRQSSAVWFGDEAGGAGAMGLLQKTLR